MRAHHLISLLELLGLEVKHWPDPWITDNTWIRVPVPGTDTFKHFTVPT